MMPSMGLALIGFVAVGILFAAPAGARAHDFSGVDAVIERAIANGACPNAEIIVGRGDELLHHKAFGQAWVRPQPQPMTPGLVFDLASLTKPVATATAIMILHDRGRLNVDDPVARHIPEFAAAGKQDVTIAQCLTHTAGFIADNPMSDYQHGADHAINAILNAPLKHPPGERFVYSDVGYIVLAEVVRRVDGRPLDRFAAEEIFRPLGMSQTRYLPDGPPETIVPTEAIDGRFDHGVVHDPRARQLGGVAGHAGLFGTAPDLARFCRMLLNGGELEGTRVLSRDAVAEMIRPRPGPDGTIRTFGFDVVSSYDSPRGAHFEKGVSVGHTGFTGTSVWIDPRSGVYVILFTSRLHPDGQGDVRKLRYDVATAAAEAMGIRE